MRKPKPLLVKKHMLSMKQINKGRDCLPVPEEKG